MSMAALLFVALGATNRAYASEFTDRGFSEPPASIESISISKLLDVNGTGGEYLPDCDFMQITSNQTTVSGSSLVSKVPINLADSFETSFYVYLGSHQKNMNDVSDGATFFLTNSARGSKYIGVNQYGMNAYSPNTTNNSLIAVEFDTFYNTTGFVNDADVQSWEDERVENRNGSDAGHVAIRTQNSAGVVSNHLGVKYGTGAHPLADGNWHRVTIRWTPATSTIIVNYDAFTEPITATIDLNAIGMSQGDDVYFGFSGGTGRGTSQGMIFTKLPTQASPGLNVVYKDEANNVVETDEVKGQIGQEVDVNVNKFLGTQYKYDKTRTLAKNTVSNIELLATKKDIEVYYINIGAKKTLIDNEATKIKTEIDNDPTLSADEKTAQKDAVDEAATDAKNAIDLAESNEAAEQAKTDGIAAINNQHQSGKTVDEQKQEAKTAIDEEAARVKDEIDKDETLTEEEKNRQKDGVDQEAAKAKEAIDNAADADAINQAEASGKEAIDNQHQSGKTVDEQKQEAKTAIDEEAARVKDEIDKDGTLTEEEKNRQKDGVDQEAAKAKEAIDNAADANAISQAETSGKEAIDNQHQSGKTVDEQKQEAKTAIDEEAARVKDEIDKDGTLTEEEKNRQKDGVDQEAAKAKEAIDNATTIDAIKQAETDGKAAINNQHQPGKTVDEQKQEAKTAIDEEAKKVKEAIDKDPTLTEDEKNRQKAAVDQEAEKAKKAIDQGQTAEAIKQAKLAGIQAIRAQHKSKQTAVATTEETAALPQTGTRESTWAVTLGLVVFIFTTLFFIKKKVDKA